MREMRTPLPDLTIAVQDYLKAIYVLESSGELVTTSALAHRISPYACPGGRPKLRTVPSAFHARAR